MELVTVNDGRLLVAELRQGSLGHLLIERLHYPDSQLTELQSLRIWIILTPVAAALDHVHDLVLLTAGLRWPLLGQLRQIGVFQRLAVINRCSVLRPNALRVSPQVIVFIEVAKKIDRELKAGLRADVES